MPSLIEQSDCIDDVKLKLSREEDRGHITPCWILQKKPGTNGYGRIYALGRKHQAHRFTYEMVHGPIPTKMVIDHLCKTPMCINPSHLEVVSNRENTLRGNASAINRQRLSSLTHCSNGHEFTPENTKYRLRRGVQCRRCVACMKTYDKTSKAKIKGPKLDIKDLDAAVVRLSDPSGTYANEEDWRKAADKVIEAEYSIVKGKAGFDWRCGIRVSLRVYSTRELALESAKLDYVQRNTRPAEPIAEPSTEDAYEWKCRLCGEPLIEHPQPGIDGVMSPYVAYAHVGGSIMCDPDDDLNADEADPITAKSPSEPVQGDEEWVKCEWDDAELRDVDQQGVWFEIWSAKMGLLGNGKSAEDAWSDARRRLTSSASAKSGLLPCPFCGQELDAQWNRSNPKARCRTDGCKGNKLPVLNLDVPEDIAAWNTRAASAKSEEKSDALTVDSFAAKLKASGIEYPFATIEQQRDIYRDQLAAAQERIRELEDQVQGEQTIRCVWCGWRTEKSTSREDLDNRLWPSMTEHVTQDCPEAPHMKMAVAISGLRDTLHRIQTRHANYSGARDVETANESDAALRTYADAKGEGK